METVKELEEQIDKVDLGIEQSYGDEYLKMKQKMKQKKTITQIMGNKETLVGLILGASVGYIGAELAYLVHYLFYKEIELVSFSINSLWGIFLLGVWWWMIKKIQQRSIE